MRLTQTSIGQCVLAPGETDRIFPDHEITGFGLRVRAGGSRKWVLHYRQGGTQRRLTIGPASVFSLKEARDRARKVLIELHDGHNPAALKATRRAAAALMFGQVVNDYLDARTDLKPRSHVESTRHLRKNWKPFHGLPIASITRPLVAARLRQLSEAGAIDANRARSNLSALFIWAIGEGLCDVNPVMGTNKNAEPPRERVLSINELVAVWKAVPENDYGRIVRLLMLTGQRREEIGELRWSEIKGEGATAAISLPAIRTKNARPHEVPLSPAALFLLPVRSLNGGERVFGPHHWSYYKEQVDYELEIEPWTVHDLRRSAATGMADLGVQPHVIEAVLNHVSGHKAGVAGIYNRSTYASEKRAALELWAGHLMAAIEKGA